MKEKFNYWLWNVTLEYRWWAILRYRRYLSSLYEAGTPMNASRFTAASARLSRHCCWVQRQMG